MLFFTFFRFFHFFSLPSETKFSLQFQISLPKRKWGRTLFHSTWKSCEISRDYSPEIILKRFQGKFSWLQGELSWIHKPRIALKGFRVSYHGFTTLTLLWTDFRANSQRLKPWSCFAKTPGCALMDSQLWSCCKNFKVSIHDSIDFHRSRTRRCSEKASWWALMVSGCGDGVALKRFQGELSWLQDCLSEYTNLALRWNDFRVSSQLQGELTTLKLLWKCFTMSFTAPGCLFRMHNPGISHGFKIQVLLYLGFKVSFIVNCETLLMQLQGCELKADPGVVKAHCETLSQQLQSCESMTDHPGAITAHRKILSN